MTDLSVCDLAPARCPPPRAVGMAVGAQRAGRRGGTWLTQLPHTRLLISAEMLQWVPQLVMPGKCRLYPASPTCLRGKQEAVGNPCTIPAVLHHKS